MSFISIQTGCSSKSMKDSKAEAKFDAPLRMKFREIKQAKVDAPLKCLVKLNGSFDEKKKEILKEAGISVLTVLKEIITIEGQPDAIRQVASYDFVHSISLSQTRYPLKKQ
jgi:hypothetical protein